MCPSTSIARARARTNRPSLPAADPPACYPARAARETAGGVVWCSLALVDRHGASALAHPDEADEQLSRWQRGSVQVLRRPALREEAPGRRRLPTCRQQRGRRRRLVLGRAGVLHLHHWYIPFAELVEAGT